MLRPADWFTIVYLGLGLGLMLLFPGRVEHFATLVPAHAGGILAIVLARRLRLDRFRLGGILLDFYPLPLFALFYSEVGELNRILHPDRFFDDTILHVEETLFRSQPSQEFHLWVPVRALGEYLHLGYFSYYLLVPVMAFTVRFTRGRLSYERAIACVCLAFYASFLVFIAFPVTGPYHVFPHSDPAAYGYRMPYVARWVVDQGSSLGTAFPSSHVSVATATWIMAMRYRKWLAVAYAFLVPALAAGAVYGGFHYATDIAAGAVLGILCGTLGHSLAVALSQGTRRALALGRTG